MAEWDPQAFVPPMLAWTEPRPFDDERWRFEIKWDGYRALIHTVKTYRVFTRRGRDMFRWYPSLADLRDAIPAGVVLDAELVAMGDTSPDFFALRSAAGSGTKRAVTLVVFDLLYANARWLIDLPLSERLKRLDDLIPDTGPLVRSWGEVGVGTRLLRVAGERGLEGVMAKALDSRYFPGRRVKTWRKFLNKTTRRFWVLSASRGADGSWYWEIRQDRSLLKEPMTRLRAPSQWRAPDTRAERVAVEPPLWAAVSFRQITPDGKLRHAGLKEWGVGAADADRSASR